MRTILAAYACCICMSTRAQSLEWWAETVKWDGVSPWSNYIIYQPAYLGPNALPVPALGNGNIDSSLSVASGINFHFSPGDKTQNITLYGNYCLVKDVISFDISWVPYERFNMDHSTKEKRHVFSEKYYDKHTSGDIHLNTNIRLLKRWQNFVQLAMRIGYRFPSGSISSARYSDGPGYYFDVSFGKPLNREVKLIGMAGFYVWQLEKENFKQNDAFLCGSGFELNKNNWRVQSYLAGYFGYMENSGDKPLVFRANIEKKFKKSGMFLKFQRGLHDFGYTSTEAGARFYLD